MQIMPKPGVLLGLCLLAASCADGKTSPQPVAPTASVTVAPVAPTPASAPGAAATIDAVPLRVGAPVPLPDDIALIIEVGCWQCDGDWGGLVRIYRDAAGVLQEMSLIGGVRANHIVSPDGSQVAYSTCSPEICDGFNLTNNNVQSTIGWSRDGGVTSTTYPPLEGVYAPAAVVRGMLLATGRTAGLDPLPVLRYPSGDAFTPPPGGVHSIATGWDQLAFLTADRRMILLGPDVEAFDLDEGRRIDAIAPEDAAGERLLVSWSERLAMANPKLYISIVVLDEQRYRIQRTFSLARYLGNPAGWLDGHTAVGTYDFSNADIATQGASSGDAGSRPLPAIFDFNTGTIHPIIDPFLSATPYANGRNFVLAVIRGPFARVVNTGSCLNLRTEPRTTAPVKTCAADNVLLRTLGPEEIVDGTTWLLVAMPDGDDGWVTSEFIER